MTGLEHYEAAEKLLDTALDVDAVTSALLVGRAQVHATLAMAAADERIAADDDRIAGCIPDGGHNLGVSVAGVR